MKIIPALAALALVAAAPLTVSASMAPRSAEKAKILPQPCSIAVLVTDIESGVALEGALVKIAAIGPVDPVWMGYTGKTGMFQVNGLDRGTYAVHAEFEGMMADQVVKLGPGATLRLAMALGEK
jgi:hypothetical protein